MEKPPFLFAMHRRVSRIKIQDQHRRRLLMRGNELLHQRNIDRPSRLPGLAVLEPAQRRSARQIFACTSGHLMHRVMSKQLGVIQILPACDKRHHPLAQHRLTAVAHLAQLPTVV